MALTYSKMLDLGTSLPKFELLNVVNNSKYNSDLLSKNKGKVIMFICNHCPYVIHYHEQLKSITEKYIPNIDFVAISSNDIENYPQDSPEKMKELAKKLKFKFPYLFDETQEVAKQYQALCTPEFYFFDKNNILVYRGRLDDSSPGNGKKATGKDLREAIECYLNGEKITENQYPSMGCNIKWKV